MTLLEMLEYLPDNKKSRPLASLGITERTARHVANGKINTRQKRNLYAKLKVSSQAEARAKIAYKIAKHNNLPIDFTYSLDLGTYDSLSVGAANTVVVFQ